MIYMANSEKEFNLSEKIFNPTKVFLLQLPTPDSINCVDVKEFIRLLKEQMTNSLYEIQRFKGVSASAIKFVTELQINVDRLAGDKLI